MTKHQGGVRRPRPVRRHLIDHLRKRCPSCGKQMFLSKEAVEAALERLRWRSFMDDNGRGEQRYYACGMWEGLPVYHLTSHTAESYDARKD